MEEILQRGLSVEIPKRYFCAVNLYYDIKKTEQFVNKTDKFIRQTDKINVEIQKKEAQKTESELKKYMKAKQLDRTGEAYGCGLQLKSMKKILHKKENGFQKDE